MSYPSSYHNPKQRYSTREREVPAVNAIGGDSLCLLTDTSIPSYISFLVVFGYMKRTLVAGSE